jgi:uncharacterized Zn finger protein (UPF0148 family)
MENTNCNRCCHPAAMIWDEGKMKCPNCGSSELGYASDSTWIKEYDKARQAQPTSKAVKAAIHKTSTKAISKALKKEKGKIF